jgi:Tfp pilus assembly protein PilF
VRVNARLIYAGTDTQLWNQTFEAAMSDVLTIQSRIATAVAEGISLRLSEQQRLELAADASGAGAQDPVAFDLYLHGRYYWNMRTEEGFRRAIQYFQEAVDRDPNSARAYAGLADTYSLLHVYRIMPRADAESAALVAANKALSLDDNLAEAHTAIAYIRMQRFEWKVAETEFRRALTLKPSSAAAHRWYATWLAKQGRTQDALAEMKTALDQDPLSVGGYAVQALLLAAARRYDEGIAHVQKAMQMDPSFVRGRMQLAEIYAFQRQYARALAEAEAAAAAAPRGDLELLADLGYIRAVAGRRADALKVRDELIRRASANEDAAAGGVAIISVGLGDTERAFEWLAKARDLRDPGISYLKVDPRFDSVRQDPRFARLLASVGLAQ